MRIHASGRRLWWRVGQSGEGMGRKGVGRGGERLRVGEMAHVAGRIGVYYDG
jgi:hypothetical protein